MSNISIIISGNLTGFSRFFAFDADNRMGDAKFDFDFRNPLFFLKSEQTAYAISFAPTMIAYSRVNRILDAYRRPGIVVSSVLLPRNTILKSLKDSKGEHSIFQLLNDLQERFLTHHVKNGMLGSNVSLLMQNDYVDIISAYELYAFNQRMLNDSAVRGRDGYVITDESLVEKYLANPCRRKFDGYGNVFLVSEISSPINGIIDEPAEETISYSVLFNGHAYGEVRSLDEKISFCEQPTGYEPLLGEYSYNDIIGGADDRLKASIIGEAIQVTYNPKVMMYPLSIFFVDRNKKAFDSVESVGYLNNACIYVNKELCVQERDENGNICIPGNLLNAKLEIKEKIGSDFKFMNNAISMRDKNYIIVEPILSPISLDFSYFPKSKMITLTNCVYSKEKLSEEIGLGYTLYLFGKIEDWEIAITSDYYQDVRCSLTEFIKQPSLKEKKGIEVTFSVYGILGKKNIRLIVNDKLYNFSSDKPNKTVSVSSSKIKYEVVCDGYHPKSGEKSFNNVVSAGIKVTMTPTFLSKLKINLKYVIPSFLFLLICGGTTIYLLTHKEEKVVVEENKAKEEMAGADVYSCVLKLIGPDDSSTAMINEMFKKKEMFLIDDKSEKYSYTDLGFEFELSQTASQEEYKSFSIAIPFENDTVSLDLNFKIALSDTTTISEDKKYIVEKKLDNDLMVTYFCMIDSLYTTSTIPKSARFSLKSWYEMHSREEVEGIYRKWFPKSSTEDDYRELCDPSTTFTRISEISEKYKSQRNKVSDLAGRLLQLKSEKWPTIYDEFKKNNGLENIKELLELLNVEVDQCASLQSYYKSNYKHFKSVQDLYNKVDSVYQADCKNK